MAFSQSSIQIQWGGSDTVSIASGGSQTSDTFTVSSNLTGGEFDLLAEHSGTPADGDEIDLYLIRVSDPDNDAADEDTNQGHYLTTLDTYKAYQDTGSGDTYCKRQHPAFGLYQSATYKLQADNTGASSITVSGKLDQEEWN